MNTNSHRRALLAVFEAGLGPLVEVEARTRSWASATFAGTRHTLGFVVGAEAKLVAFQAGLGDLEIALRGGFVADIAVVSITRCDDERRRVVVDALVIDDV